MYQNDGRREDMNLGVMWDQLRRILEEAGIESGGIAESVLDDIGTTITRGKAEPFGSGGSGAGSGYCNAIPGYPGEICHRQLWVKCYDRDNLASRLTSMIYHAGIYCPDENKEVIFITTQWTNQKYSPHKYAVNCLKRKGVKFAFVLISDSGIAPIYI